MNFLSIGSKSTISKIFKNLRDVELINEIKVGFQNTNKIYVKNINI